MLSNKIIDENPHSNWYWAMLCGVSLEDMNFMERTIMKILDYNLHIVISQKQAINIYKSIY
jgi:hypothetical protein